LNDLMLAGTLCGVEMALSIAGVPFKRGGVDAAMDTLAADQASGSGLRTSGEPLTGARTQNPEA
jgi:alanine-glyoxylate transaminase/serine-glyoxylate transaminase/serine-pyruvate transaminase